MFEFFRGSNYFKVQKVYLLRLMPIFVVLTMVSCLFLLVPLITTGVYLNRAECKAACRLLLTILNRRNIGTMQSSVADPGSGIGCLFDPWIRDPGWEKVSMRIRDPG